MNSTPSPRRKLKSLNPQNYYILSANTYNLYSGKEEISHRDPKEILKEVADGTKKLESALDKVNKLL